MKPLFLLLSVSIAQIQIPLSRLASGNKEHDFDKTLYTATVSIGTPAQNFTLLFDTASPYTYVLALNSTSSHPAQNRYVPESSESFGYQDSQLMDLQQKGRPRGRVFEETISLLSDKTAYNQTFVLASSDDSESFGAIEVDGVLGMAQYARSNNSSSIIKTLQDQGVIEKAQFALYLAADDFGSSSIDQKSNLIIGGSNVNKYASEKFTKVKLSKSPALTGLWGVSIKSFWIDNKEFSSSKQDAVIDSGYALLSMPTDDREKLYEEIQNYNQCGMSQEGFLACSCAYQFRSNGLFPDITLEIDGENFKLTPDNYIKEEGSYCVIMIDESKYEKQWILGGIFLRQYYTLFDLDHGQVGFAKVKSNKTETWVWALVIAAHFLVILLALALLYGCFRLGKYCYMRRREQSQNSGQRDQYIAMQTRLNT